VGAYKRSRLDQDFYQIEPQTLGTAITHRHVARGLPAPNCHDPGHFWKPPHPLGPFAMPAVLWSSLTPLSKHKAATPPLSITAGTSPPLGDHLGEFPISHCPCRSKAHWMRPTGMPFSPLSSEPPSRPWGAAAVAPSLADEPPSSVQCVINDHGLM
jgi:hypothetical protein